MSERAASPSPVGGRMRRLLPFGAVAVLVALVFAGYLRAMTAGAGGLAFPLAFPLDDAYIHLQYARAVGEGHPFRYQAADAPTSGGTSLLYPFLLGAFYGGDSTGQTLINAALTVNLLSWLSAAFSLYALIASSRYGHYPLVGLIGAGAFAAHGALGWAFMSGMESGLFIASIFATLWAAQRDERGAILAGSALAALIRPEGVLIGLGAGLYLLLRFPRQRAGIWIAGISLLAALIQPAINLALTGSLTASGMQAKSYLYNVPADLGTALRETLNNALRLWRELFSISDPDYATLFLATGGLLAVGIALRRRKPPSPPQSHDPPSACARRTPSTAGRGEGENLPRYLPRLILFWLVGLTGIVSLVETAFWHFKRYQMPIFALLFPLAGWLAAALIADRRRLVRYGGVALLTGIGLHSALTYGPFVVRFRDNVHEVRQSQQQMAAYVRENLPAGAVIGVHDIGAMAFFGGHPTYDLVGLTTPGAAIPWRNGPGAVFETLYRSALRPAYFAIYPDARGLTYFQNTGLFGETLAAFPSTRPPYNVASATETGQIVYRADWTYAASAAEMWGAYTREAVKNLTAVDALNVAWLDDERAHAYAWSNADSRPGFPTELYEMEHVACAGTAANPACRALDGGRLISASERMTITTRPGEALIWVMRVHPRDRAALNLFVNGQPAGTRIVPVMPGRWLEIASYVPGEMITGTHTDLRVEVDLPAGGHYMPYHHWFYQGPYAPDVRSVSPGAVFAEQVALLGYDVTYDADSRALNLETVWRRLGEAPIDAVMFLHLYDTSGALREDAQGDGRIGDGALPPANWLPGPVRDTRALILPPSVPPGRYTVAIGLYDPVALSRLPANGPMVGAENRVFVGAISVR